MAGLLEVHTTFPDGDKAAEIARTLVQEGLAACAQLVPHVTTIFRWEGMLRHESEVLCLLKTSRERWTDLRDRLIELHPYDTPEVVALPLELSCFKYSTWVRESV